ncbi:MULTISPECIES: MFS transporter [unclassified Pseudomonas]|uniref:MFS transporter n=1 Tax=unclassified Pseudomonas TaxID=196821 RepID=UPI002AC9A0E1|nr:MULTISPECIES: MFS transporter [unclassified Pseudomonas]MEB0041974.1 MFS transporter [Pseudomonas sp. MH10]MEB0079091.1 MFS transporter [Pseudomonas sp. MH10out]MEB0092102.1 MFS transporter [Pseudomonas sp. CCI4.2]MEB0100473.1 MFS transporter [Pseudomonas sp. CCI3.2]MEB0123623.1 MFS transporter [Pseudomonas sp. CCI1.2]
MPDSSPAAAERPMAVTLQVVSIVLFTFIGYLNIGIPLAVLPSYVHTDLGFGAVAAGLVISVQYLATLLSRPYAGRIIDNRGSKKAVIYGLAGCGLSGVFMLVSAWLHNAPMLSLICLFIGRLVLGSAESLVGSGSIGWGIGKVGALNTAKVISWNGIASYGALAIGAPLGVLLVQEFGLWSMGFSIILLAALGLKLAWNKEPAPIVMGERLPFMHVLGRVLPHGTGLALGSIGFGTIATFITLYYASHSWPNAVLCLSLFGACFIGARLLFGKFINRLGGFRVAIACLSVETLGLVLLWVAPTPSLALAGAALTGFGFSLVFPALGVEAVNLVPASSRGAAVGAYSLFIDLSLGITGPVAGAIASGFGFASIFLFAALAALTGLILSVYLYRQAVHLRDYKP